MVPWFLVTPSQLRAPRRGDPRRRFRSVSESARLVTNRNLLGICLGFFCFDYYWYFLVNWLPDYLVTSAA